MSQDTTPSRGATAGPLALPLRVTDEHPNRAVLYIRDAEGIEVACVYSVEQNFEQTAKAIVLACNAHAGLVEALELMLEHAPSMDGRVVDVARTALSNAKGKGERHG